MVKTIEFMFGGGRVKVQIQPKEVVVNFFGRALQFSATQAALRERVRAEIRKAGLMPDFERVLRGKA